MIKTRRTCTHLTKIELHPILDHLRTRIWRSVPVDLGSILNTVVFALLISVFHFFSKKCPMKQMRRLFGMEYKIDSRWLGNHETEFSL